MDNNANSVESIKTTLKLIPILKTQFNVKRNADEDDPLLFIGVAESNLIDKLRPVVEVHFGAPYKPAGESAFWKNLFDSFVKNIGGIRTEQTLFKKEISPTLALFCAFWPWGSNPVNTSIRIGLLCESEEEEQALAKEVKAFFR
ncbi:MAG: hypothetical protein HQM09_13795 [Candidatus Riflebacteria bacterium]|nr:hypothetical protein [Candidatus Riflebacteria bacterium]